LNLLKFSYIYKILVIKPYEKRTLRDLGVNWTITLSCIFEKWDSASSGQNTTVAFVNISDDPFSSIKEGNFLIK
jgi:hypothetical protein